MSHQRGMLDPALVEQRPHQLRLSARRVIAFRSVAPAKALQVHRDHAMVAGEHGDEPVPYLEGRCEAVQQHNRCARASIDIMDSRAAYAFEAAVDRFTWKGTGVIAQPRVPEHGRPVRLTP